MHPASRAIALHGYRLMSREVEWALLLFGLPLIFIPFLLPAYQWALSATDPSATGAEHGIPGMTVMFGSFLVGFTGFGFFREHGWGTWARLRASAVPTSAIVMGKLLPPLTAGVSQVVFLVVTGRVVFGLPAPQLPWALVPLALALPFCLVSLGLALASVCRSLNQLNAVANLSGIVGAGLGGAFVPLDLVPSWARPLAPTTPAYWAMKGFGGMADGDVGAVATSSAVLVAFGCAALVIAATTFRAAASKEI